MDVLRIRLVVLSEATIIKIESDPRFHADQQWGTTIFASSPMSF